MCNDIITIDRNQPVTDNKIETSKTVSTLFDVSDNEDRSNAGEQINGALMHRNEREARSKSKSGDLYIDRVCDGKEKVFTYKTGVSFHVGKYTHTSSHSAGVSQKNYSSEFSQSPNFFRVSQSRSQPYTDVCGGIEFPKIKMVPVDTFRFKHRKRRQSFLNEEEMEAAEALADFAYRIRHGDSE